MSLVIPPSMHAAIAFFLGDSGADEWLSELPRKIEKYVLTWNLETQEVLLGGVMSCCVKCIDSNAGICVLKIPLDARGGALEGAALAAWSGSGGVPKVHARDPVTGTTLMQFIDTAPSTREPVDAIVELLDRLHGVDGRVLNYSTVFSPLRSNVELRKKWAEDRFANPEYAEGLRFIDAAKKIAEELLREPTSPTQLLHGDLQGKNIITSSDGRFMAIDPLPALGDFHYDAAFWCVMEETSSCIEENLLKVSDQLSFINFDRLHGWARALAALELRPYLPASRARMLEFLESSESG